MMLKAMVPVLDGNSEHDSHESRKMGLFGEKKIQFVTTLDLMLWLKQTK